MECLQCQHKNALDGKFCNQCAALFAPVCVACRHENTGDTKLCNQCGTILARYAVSSNPTEPMRYRTEVETQSYGLLPAVIALLEREVLAILHAQIRL